MSAGDILEYFAALYGGTPGFLHIGVGQGIHLVDNGKPKHKRWSETVFDLPRESDRAAREILQASTDCDVYVCASLMRGRARSKGAAVQRAVIHADVDNGRLDPKQVGVLGGFAIASGTAGNGHAYVPVAESLTVAEFEVLCRALGAYLGAVDSKISDNDFLRPPSTFNHKPTCTGGDPAPVRWLVHPARRRPVSKTTLANTLGIDLANPANTVIPPRCAAVTEPVNLDDHPNIVAALDQSTCDRSADTMRIVGVCFWGFLTLAQTRWVINTRSDLVERLRNRNDDDVLTCWLKTVDSRQTRCATYRERERRPL